MATNSTVPDDDSNKNQTTLSASKSNPLLRPSVLFNCSNFSAASNSTAAKSVIIPSQMKHAVAGTPAHAPGLASQNIHIEKMHTIQTPLPYIMSQ